MKSFQKEEPLGKASRKNASRRIVHHTWCIRKAHHLRCHIFKLLNNFSGHFLPIFWTISYKFLFQMLNINWTLLPTSGDSIIIFLFQVPKISIPRGSYSFFLVQVMPTFLWIFSFNLVLSNIDMLHPFMVAWCYHTTSKMIILPTIMVPVPLC